MGWHKSSPELQELFDQLVPERPNVVRRKMFGYPSAFVNGHLFAGTHEHRIVLRLDEPDREKAGSELGAVEFAPMPGRVMREYAALEHPLDVPQDVLAGWVLKAHDFVAAKPPKPAKPRKQKKGTSAKKKTS